MIDIYLHGSLKKLCAEPLTFAVSTPAEAIRALCSQVKGFEKAVREGSFVLMRGDLNNGVAVSEETLTIGFGESGEFHIIPEAQGAWAQVVYGIILLLAVFAATNTPKVNNYEERNEESKQSHLFNGALNTTEQGQSVPVVYGRMKTGSVVVSAGLSSEQVRA